MARILVVDDEPKITSFITRALTASGFAVDCASDGARALELARTGAYTLVVLDLRLPGIDGTSVLRETLAERPEQQIIVLSALADVESKVRCLDLGAVDYLTKPFDLAELLARIRTRLRAPANGNGQRVLRAGRLTLDLQRRTADVGAGPVRLSTREFLLLEHLMRRREDVCTREELLGAVWGYDFDPGTNVVDVYVGRLRSKLGSEIIDTIRNVGYCFQAP